MKDVRTTLFLLIATAPLTLLSAIPAVSQVFEPVGPGTPQTGTASGGSRPIDNTCLKTPTRSANFIAIASPQNSSFTSQTRPTVWVYLPPTHAETLEFSVFDPQQTGIYQTEIAIEGRSGLVPLSLPPTVALQQNQKYSWTAALVCDPHQRTNDWLVGGSIEPRSLTPNLQRQLAQASDVEQIALYAKAGFWYDAVQTYFELRQSKSQDPRLTPIGATLFR